MCLAKFQRMGQQLQQGIMLTGVVYTIAAAQLMKMIYVSEAHRAANTAETDSASFLSFLYHDYHGNWEPEFWSNHKSLLQWR